MRDIIKFVIIIIISGLLLPACQSCQKYVKGHSFSLVSRTSRVANTWHIEYYKVNDDDYTTIVSDYSETYTKKKGYSYAWDTLIGSGNWEFQNNDMEIKLTGNSEYTSRTLHILKLERKSFWYYYNDGSFKHEIHLESN